METVNQRARYRAAARRLYHDAGRIEVGDNAQVSVGETHEGGAYVQAWVWVSDEDCNECPGAGDDLMSGVDNAG